jgi:hypothetical protein
MRPIRMRIKAAIAAALLLLSLCSSVAAAKDFGYTMSVPEDPPPALEY